MKTDRIYLLAAVFAAGLMACGSAWNQEPDPQQAPAQEATAESGSAQLAEPGVDFSGTALILNQVHAGELLATHPQMGDDTHADCFQFEATEGLDYSFTLRSADFDSYLLIGVGFCQDVLLQHENDDFEEDSVDSQVVLTATYPFYSVYVNSYEPAATGSYTLVVEQLSE